MHAPRVLPPRDALPALEVLRAHADARTVEDARAAVDAIASQNHHFFIDRQHSGRMFLELDGGAPPP